MVVHEVISGNWRFEMSVVLQQTEVRSFVNCIPHQILSERSYQEECYGPDM
jgi:hypothetical protein